MFYILKHLYERDFQIQAKEEDLHNLIMTSFSTLADQYRNYGIGLLGRTQLTHHKCDNYKLLH